MKRILLSLLLVVLISGCMQNHQQIPEAKAVPVPTPVEVIPQIEELKVEDERKTVMLDLAVFRNRYFPFFDFLEYGKNKNDSFQPEGTTVQFELYNLEGYDYHCLSLLESPNYRALIRVFPDLVTPREKGFKIKVSYNQTGDCDLIHLISVHDPNGNKVWDYNMKVKPRPLTPLEKRTLDQAELNGDEDAVASWFDYKPHCDASAGLLDECQRVFSPSEEFARLRVFYLKTRDPNLNVWVRFNNYNGEETYRWVDHESGEVLANVDSIADLWEMPKSGFLALQRKSNDAWETIQAVNIKPGWVVSTDRTGSIYEVLPLEIFLRNPQVMYVFILKTILWEDEEMLSYLNLDASYQYQDDYMMDA